VRRHVFISASAFCLRLTHIRLISASRIIRQLDWFLTRVVNHPKLRESKPLNEFLTTDDQDIDGVIAHSASEAKKEAPTWGWAAKEWQTSMISSFSGKPANNTEKDTGCESMLAYTNTVATSLKDVSSQVDHLVAHNKGDADSWANLAVSFSSLSAVEERNPRCASVFNTVAVASDSASQTKAEQVDKDNLFFGEPLQQYMKLLGSVKDMLRVRQSHLLTYQTAVGDFETKKAAFHKKQSGGKDVSKEEVTMDAAEAKMEASLKDYNVFKETSNGEYNAFLLGKTEDMKRTCADFARLQADHHRKMLAMWEKTEEDLDAI
jgi:hypothetical protein